MEKVKKELAPLSPDSERGCKSPRHDCPTSTAGRAGEEGDEEAGETPENTTTAAVAPLRKGRYVTEHCNGTVIVNGVTKETAYHASEIQKEVPVIELARRGGSADIKAREQTADGRRKVQTTELCRPPIHLPLPTRELLSETRMVQLSPPAFPPPARAMLYDIAQPLATVNR